MLRDGEGGLSGTDESEDGLLSRRRGYLSDTFDSVAISPEQVGSHDVLEFPAGIALGTVQGDQTFMLVASDARRGLIRYAPWGACPRQDTRRVFIVADQRFGPVRLYAHVLGPPQGEDAETCVVVQWVMVTATERREHLARALEGLLAVRAAVTESDEPLGPHRKLIYDAVTQQVRLIWTEKAEQAQPGERKSSAPGRGSDLPRRAQRLVTADEVRNPPPVTPAASGKSQPRILVQLAEPASSDERLRTGRGLHDYAAPDRRTPDTHADSYRRGGGAAGRRYTGRGQDAAESDPGIVLRDVGRRPRARAGTPTPVGSFAFSRSVGGRSGRREPLCPRDNLPGVLRVEGNQGFGPDLPLTFGWIGTGVCVFFIASSQAPELGASVEVGVPGAPLSAEPIWVVGSVALLTVDRSGGQSMVEVSLTGSQPAQYVSLVRYWMQRRNQ